MKGARWWVALVNFERGDGEQSVLEARFQGAWGWMACLASSEDEVRTRLAQSLAADGLRLVKVDQEAPVEFQELSEIDDHLASNVAALEPGKFAAWGTIHCYLAEGEA
jgi:hypothetical protein